MASRPSALSEAAPGTPHAARVAALNDAFRRTFVGGQVIETAGVRALSERDRISLLLAVRRYEGFEPDNDPHGEHDFGTVEVGGERFFWKIDYHDRALSRASPNPADPSVTTRVLTLMLAEEY